MKEKSLYLIDGNSILYRAYYAIRNLATSQGFPTNAIYGFLQTLGKIKEEKKPPYLAIVFDAHGPTIRHEAYQEYKANRKPMPEDLVIQVPLLKKILQAQRLKLLEIEKFEADDVLASLAIKAATHGYKPVIVTTDKDLLQVVTRNIFVFNPVKNKLYTPEEVKRELGVYPQQVIDVLALMGDSSDNVPGVPGIGLKTARKLIQQFGSLTNLLNNLDKLKNPRVKNTIANNLDVLELSKNLVTVESQIPLPFHPEEFRVGEEDGEALIQFYRDLEFHSLLQASMAKIVKEGKKQKLSYEIVDNEEQLLRLLPQLKAKKQLSIDTETTSPDPTRARLVGISFTWAPHQAFYLPLGHDYPGAPAQIPISRAVEILHGVLANPEIKKIGQNIKYDLIVLRRAGFEVKGIDTDTMILSYLLEPNWGKHNLDKLAAHYLQTSTISYHDIAGKGAQAKTMDKIAIETVAPYACQDADLAWQLAQVLWPRVEQAGLSPIYRQIELPLIEVLADMEMWGVKVDRLQLAKISQEIKQEMQQLENKIFSACGLKFNLNSPQQLSRVLFEVLRLPPSKKTKVTRRFSTGSSVLEELAKKHPIAQEILEYRQLAKLKSAYADALPKLINPQTGRIHTSYNQTVAATGRLSSSDPNLQNIPIRGEWGRRFRQAFIPEPNYLLLTADYSQIELRVLAHLSQDPALIKVFREDGDIHAEIAQQLFSTNLLDQAEQRRRAKIINFSIIYGASAYSLARELGTTPREAQQFIDLYFARFPEVKNYLQKSIHQTAEKGFAETLFGRRRPVPELKHKNAQVRQFGERIALNTPIQGTAADLIKKAMIDIWQEIKKRKLASRMIIQVHDELVFEVPDSEVELMSSLVKEKMEEVYPLAVPLKVKLAWGINWAESK
ncbi:MAG: DNA polymerase I [Candidatus Aminicenantes bacterium 4484_214]|nr:MAG: DNA polymerase I [Candidatus Aminicenantes bacterium 4484_214]RLE09955.1 MAG: DNA polymerase I [Candidatus Aminicenantes bacterium]